MNRGELQRALQVARLRPGERFELAVFPPDGVFRARPFGDPDQATTWLATSEGNTYLGLNPLRPEASFPPGRARDADVAVVRMLLIDCDPEDGDHEAAGELADRIAARLEESLRAKPARIHTGRGRQLWLEHEALVVGNPRLAVRARFLRALGARFDLEGRAHVDLAVHNPARLARLPGTVNAKTGVVARIEAEGEQSPVLFSDLERLALELEAEAGVAANARHGPTPAPSLVPASGEWPANYVAGAARRILAKMHEATEGSRNDTLNKCAFSLGQLEGGGAGVAAVLEELADLARAGGLADVEIGRTIRSGWEAGLREPRPSPRPLAPTPAVRRAIDAGARTSARASKRGPRIGLTDLGNARRLVRQHGDDLRFCEVAGGWFAWDGKRWRHDETGEAERRAKSVPRAILLKARGLFRRAVDEGRVDADAGKRLAKQAELVRQHGIRSESRRALEALLVLAETEPGVPVRAEDLDADPWLLNVENGTLDLRSGELREHRRGDLLTKLAPVAFDSAATCPTWVAFVERVLAGSPELVAFLQRALGYALTGQTSEQVLFLLYGTGSNGKSTFVETLRALLGDYALQASFDTFLEREKGSENSVARLRGARLVSAVEAKAGGQFNEALVKTVTGGDTVAARFLYREHFEFKPAFKLFLAANHKPTIRGQDAAIWRRIRLVPFTVTIPEAEKDPKLKEKLQAELPGILNWALEGCLAWQRDGLGQPPEVANATAEYRDDMDVLASFLGEKCQATPDSHVGSSELYKTYVAWAEANGERALSQTSFSLRLGERGFQRKRCGANGSRVWYGVALSNGQTSLPPLGEISALTTTDGLTRQLGEVPTNEKTELEKFPETNPSVVSPSVTLQGTLDAGWVEEPEARWEH